VRQDLRDLGIDTALTEIGLPDEFLPHATREEILEASGLTPSAVAQQVIEQFAGRRSPSVQ
jgi:1-deoxy-D-xylulose-5-phosphate synthase